MGQERLPVNGSESVMQGKNLRIGLAVMLVACIAALRAAAAQVPLNEDWVLNPGQSHIYLQTEKMQGVVEKHEFTSIDGNVGRNGDARIKIDLASLETGIDLRNVRMRFLLFETFKFPSAEITANLDKAKLAALATSSRMSYTLAARVNLHGIVKDFDIPVTIARLNDTTVNVSTIKPVEVSGETFDLMPGLAKLSDAQNGVRISPVASITFDLTFATGGSAQAAAEAVRHQRDQAKAREATANISTEACETRFTVISESNAIYFKTGSAELDPEQPLLDTGADIAQRCPTVRFAVEGHTDNVGSHRFNQRLSEQRAKSVVDYLKAKGISAARIHPTGYGETHPVAPNDSEENRAKNRRIEFKVGRN
jgi:OOP family OmpA-OmpF porin